VCAERGISEIRQILLELAQSDKDVPLQISAIAALGRLGTQQEFALLEQLLLGETERLKPAARTALKRLRQRLQVSAPVI
jgi:HEAT repeat protein